MIHLLNPSEKEILDNAGDRVPLGLLSLGTELQQKGKDVRVFDLNHTSFKDYSTEFYKDNPEAVGISVYTSPIYEEALHLANALQGQTRLIAGGYHASAMPESLIDSFDAVVVGEGENVILEALTRNGILYNTPPSLERLAKTNWDLLDMDNYGVDQSGNRTATIVTSRGCPGSCAYCGNMAKKVRYKPDKVVKEEINDLKEKGFNALYIVDDIFTASKKRMERIVKEIDIPFRITTRADLIDEDKIKILADNGCDWLSLGIESGDNNILNNVDKGMTTEQNYEAVRLASKYGIKTKGFFIIGLPGETEETARKTIDFSLRLKKEGLTKADFYHLVPFPGTPIWKNPEAFGLKIKNRNFTKYLQAGKNVECVVETKDLSSKRIEELVKEAKENWK